MRRAEVILLLLAALCWGSSFLLIKVGVQDLDPLVVMLLRVVTGGALLWIAAAWMARRIGRPFIASLREVVRTRPGTLLLLGVLTGTPLWLIALGETRIDSGLAGVGNASVPIWATLLALRWDREHPATARSFVGMGIGMAGVVGLTGARGILGGADEALGLVFVLTASAMYAISAIIVRERMAGVPSIEVAAWTVSGAALLYAPVALATGAFGRSEPTSVAMGATITLGVVGTFLGFLFYYELLHRVGAARATMVTYLIPPSALAWGAAVLGEELRPEALVATVVILLGVWIGSRPAARPAPASATAAALGADELEDEPAETVTPGGPSRSRR